MRKLNGNAAGSDKVTGEKIKGGGAVDLESVIWLLRVVLTEDWRSAGIIPLHKEKGRNVVKFGWKNICKDTIGQSS